MQGLVPSSVRSSDVCFSDEEARSWEGLRRTKTQGLCFKGDRGRKGKRATRHETTQADRQQGGLRGFGAPPRLAVWRVWAEQNVEFGGLAPLKIEGCTKAVGDLVRVGQPRLEPGPVAPQLPARFLALWQGNTPIGALRLDEPGRCTDPAERVPGAAAGTCASAFIPHAAIACRLSPLVALVVACSRCTDQTRISLHFHNTRGARWNQFPSE